MGFLEGKQGVVMGVANDKSMATCIAKILHKHGARMAFSHLPDEDDRKRMEKRVCTATENLQPLLIYPCDASNSQSINKFFAKVADTLTRVDFIVHAIAFAPIEDIRCQTVNCSRQGFLDAMNISVYSLIEISRCAEPLMSQGGSICTLTYLGGERVIPGYNMMGICKSALDTTVKYLAADLGSKNIRVNAISAGPMRTLAASAIGDFKKTLGQTREASPIKRNIVSDDLGNGALYLLSDLSSATTGEILHIDCGFNIMGAPTTNQET